MFRVVTGEEAETHCRGLALCPACGATKGAGTSGCVVCWDCFKKPVETRGGEVDGLKYDGGEFCDWLARYRAAKERKDFPTVYVADQGGRGFAVMFGGMPCNDGKADLADAVAIYVKACTNRTSKLLIPLVWNGGSWALALDVED